MYCLYYYCYCYCYCYYILLFQNEDSLVSADSNFFIGNNLEAAKLYSRRLEGYRKNNDGDLSHPNRLVFTFLLICYPTRIQFFVFFLIHF